ncbi:MAG: hypothetical protein P1U47_10945 [Zhongshania sp.]|uniref:hypothetical protein n=1 Tax=Zhongshania sp. TaxID=1971902 RepID=UPI0026343C34|nr:hypothetical protein [Zhongshania sp.]MDF1692884.1 hypothetical protein [Zhongshania sp.]
MIDMKLDFAGCVNLSLIVDRFKLATINSESGIITHIDLPTVVNELKTDIFNPLAVIFPEIGMITWATSLLCGDTLKTVAQ